MHASDRLIVAVSVAVFLASFTLTPLTSDQLLPGDELAPDRPAVGGESRASPAADGLDGGVRRPGADPGRVPGRLRHWPQLVGTLLDRPLPRPVAERDRPHADASGTHGAERRHHDDLRHRDRRDLGDDRPVGVRSGPPHVGPRSPADALSRARRRAGHRHRVRQLPAHRRRLPGHPDRPGPERDHALDPWAVAGLRRRRPCRTRPETLGPSSGARPDSSAAPRWPRPWCWAWRFPPSPSPASAWVAGPVGAGGCSSPTRHWTCGGISTSRRTPS